MLIEFFEGGYLDHRHHRTGKTHPAPWPLAAGVGEATPSKARLRKRYPSDRTSPRPMASEADRYGPFRWESESEGLGRWQPFRRFATVTVGDDVRVHTHGLPGWTIGVVLGHIAYVLLAAYPFRSVVGPTIRPPANIGLIVTLVVGLHVGQRLDHRAARTAHAAVDPEGGRRLPGPVRYVGGREASGLIFGATWLGWKVLIPLTMLQWDTATVKAGIHHQAFLGEPDEVDALAKALRARTVDRADDHIEDEGSSAVS